MDDRGLGQLERGIQVADAGLAALVRGDQGQQPQPHRVGQGLEQRGDLAEAGLASVDERATTCCYAKQDKFWVQGAPNGESWEVYTVLEDSPTFYGEQDGPACCEVNAQESDPVAISAAPCC